MTLLDALADDAIFAPHFGAEWDQWRTFLRATFGLPLTPDELALFTACTGRTTAPTSQAREVWCIAGRRAGKSRIASLVAVFLAAFRDYATVLDTGEVGTLPVVAADRRQARTCMQYIAALIEDVPMLADLVVGRTTESVELASGCRVEIHTASWRALRGYTVVGAVLDEVCYWRSEDAANPDHEIVTALRPAMVTVPGALLVAISSPYARRGIAWDMFKRHHGPQGDPAILTWQAASRVMNATIPEAIVAEALEQDESAARAEWLAEWRRDVEAFVSREVLDSCVVPGRQGLPPCGEQFAYHGFVDPSGGSQDAMTLAIAHAEERDGQVVAVLDHVSERRPPFSPEEVVKEFAATLRQYGVHAVCGDRYGGAWPQERFLAHGIVYTPSERTRAEVYVECLPLLTSGRAVLLDHLRLLAQFLGLERRTSRVGRDSIDHAPGAHDDVANAAAGALVLAAQRGAGDAGVLVCEREPSDLLATMIHEFGPIEPYFRE